MQDCVRCKNHSICRLEHRNLVEKCAFVNPTEEIPIIHGKAELEEHDKRIRNKAIDDYKELLIQNNVIPEWREVIEELAEQIKGE